jgi:hypothetical protein
MMSRFPIAKAKGCLSATPALRHSKKPPTRTRPRRPAFHAPLKVGLVSMPSARALKVLKPPFMSFDQVGISPQRIESIVRTPSREVMTGKGTVKMARRLASGEAWEGRGLYKKNPPRSFSERASGATSRRVGATTGPDLQREVVWKSSWGPPTRAIDS